MLLGKYIKGKGKGSGDVWELRHPGSHSSLCLGTGGSFSSSVDHPCLLSTLGPSLPGLRHLPCVLPTTKPGTPGFAQLVPPNEERFSAGRGCEGVQPA